MAMPAHIREAAEHRYLWGVWDSRRDIGRAVAFLTADANDYITGINLPVNGGICVILEIKRQIKHGKRSGFCDISDSWPFFPVNKKQQRIHDTFAIVRR